jgi:hypothetical protein
MASNWEIVQQLIATSELPELGPRRRAGTSSAALLKTQLDQTLSATRLRNPEKELIRSAVLLWHDDLEASHVISQSIENVDGSYLHGIMHRREPDYGNSKYWFRRVGKHKIFSALAERAPAELAGDKVLTGRLVRRGEWDPFAFVDECEAAAALPSTDTKVALLRSVQALEIKTLLEHFCGAQ